MKSLGGLVVAVLAALLVFAPVAVQAENDTSVVQLAQAGKKPVAAKRSLPRRPTVRPGARSTARADGQALWYGARFNGRRTASGQRFNMNAFTAAHATLPFGSRVRVTNVRTGRSVVVRINDRLNTRSAVVDVSLAAARRLGMVRTGHAPVRLTVLSRPAPKVKIPKAPTRKKAPAKKR